MEDDIKLARYERIFKKYAWLILVVSTIGFIFEMLNYALPSFPNSYVGLTTMGDLDADEAEALLMIEVLYSTITYLICVFVGVRAILIANGDKESRLINLVVWALVLVYSINLVFTTFSWLTEHIALDAIDFVSTLIFLTLGVGYLFLNKKIASLQARVNYAYSQAEQED